LFRGAALSALVALALALGSPASAAELPDPNTPGLSLSERVHALIDRIKAEQGRVRTLEARFVQRQDSSMLVAPETSRGVFSYKAPESVRWEYQSPNPISVLVDGEQMTTWYRDLGRAERLKVGRYSNQVLKYLGATGSFETLLDYFSVRVSFPDDTTEPYRLILTPRYERIKRRMAGMTIWVDRELYLPVRLRYEAADGDVTEYEFLDLRVNRSIPADRFRLDLPKGVRVEETAIDRRG
jgi:outer membrane lipoprotein carrier protein